MRKALNALLAVLLAALVLIPLATASGAAPGKAAPPSKVAGSHAQLAADTRGNETKAFWKAYTGTLAPSHNGHVKTVKAKHSRTYSLNESGLRGVLAAAPREFTPAARQHPTVIAIPAPNGKFQRFAIAYSPVMQAGLARKHPEIRTYAGYGLTDPSATIRLSVTPLGFQAMVRGSSTSWYVDPTYHLDKSLYSTYLGPDLVDTHGEFVEKAIQQRQSDLVAAGTDISRGAASAALGNILRVYRLALVTDPGYSNYWGGPGNVTAAKVQLMNRVNMAYENDESFRMDLVNNNDLLNLNTYAAAIGRNGPCGNAACFTLANISGCSSLGVIGPAIARILPGGATSYDIGHLALGAPGGGVANLGVVGGANKAGGCTGINEPDGDFYAIDYVAHEMGHQFNMNHTFGGNVLNCSGGNRNNATSVEPGSGSSIMAYAGICQQDDLQPHSDPYFSERSSDETQVLANANLNPLNEVQQSAMLHFGGGNEVQQVTFGPGYNQAFTIHAGTLTVKGIDANIAGISELANTVQVNTTAAHNLKVGELVTITGVTDPNYNCASCTITAVGPSSSSFRYNLPGFAHLAPLGGGTVTPATFGATESGTTATITTTANHTFQVGDLVTVAGVTPSGYNCTACPVTAITANTFEYTAGASGLANGGAGTATKSSPFQINIGGNDSAVIGGSGLVYNATNIQNAMNAIPGFAGTVTVTGVASTGFTVTYGGATANTDVPNFAFDNLNCNGCFSQIAETNHGGAFDSFTLSYGGGPDSAVITNPGTFTTTGIQQALQGVNEVQTVSLTGYTVDGSSYTLNYNGNDSVPITRGSNNTAGGIAAAIAGGNEVQTNTFSNFNAVNPGNSYQVNIGGNLSAVLGNGGTAISNGAVAAAINAIPGFAGTVTVSGANNTSGPTITFGGASANTDVPTATIVFGACSGAGTPCTNLNRESTKGTTGIAGWVTQATVTASAPTDSGYTVTFNGLGNVNNLSVTNGTGGVTGSVVETTAGTTGILPNGANATIGGLANSGFTVTFGGTLGGALGGNIGALTFTNPSVGFSGYFGLSVNGGPAPYNKGFQQINTGDTPPSVSTAASLTIPYRTPFTLTSSGSDPDAGQTLTYMWEQNDTGTGLILPNNTKTSGALFRQFGTALDRGVYDVHSIPTTFCSNGENCTTTDPSRTFPDLQQILINNTNAKTGTCPHGVTYDMYLPIIDCYSEWLPTAGYTGPMHFRITVRDGFPGGGGSGFASTTVSLAPGTGPFLVTSPDTAVTMPAGSSQNITWDVAGTSGAPINATDVKISLSSDGGQTFPTVLAASTPNDGSEMLALPNLPNNNARVKIEAVGNVFFDISDADFVVNHAQQTITFAQPPDKTYGDPDFQVSATASSTLPVSFTTAGQCTNTGDMVHITGAGSCAITAHQPGQGTDWDAAPDVTRSFAIAKANQTITFPAQPHRTWGDPDSAVTGVSASSGLAVTFAKVGGNCTVSPAGVVHFAQTGTCTVSANQGGDQNYNPAPTAQQNVVMDKADQTINFPQPPDKTFGDPDFQLSATATSGLGVKFQDVSGKCKVTKAGVVHLTAPGSCTVRAMQSGNKDYNAAPDVQRTFQIN